MDKEKNKTPKEASKTFHNIMKASVNVKVKTKEKVSGKEGNATK
jgi:hypothetical protein